MKLYNNEDIGVHREKTCCSLDDVEDARSVAYQMDMPYYVFNFTADFHTEVMDRFVDAYENGCTPNPCIDCNRYLKFDKMFSPHAGDWLRLYCNRTLCKSGVR